MVELSKRHRAETPLLIAEIVKKSRGVFLWVKLVVRSLLNGLSDYNRISDLKRRVEFLPEDLEALYSHMLKHIDPFYRVQASQIFQIVRLAQKHSPESVTLLNLSWADDEEEDPAEHAPIGPLNQEDIKFRYQSADARLKSVCAGLLESNGPRNSSLSLDSRVMFLHRTVADWLSKPEGWEDLLSRTSGTGFSPNLSMLRSCILHLKVSEFSCHSPLNMKIISDALLIYAKGAETDLGVGFPKLLDQLDLVASHHWRTGKNNVVAGDNEVINTSWGNSVRPVAVIDPAFTPLDGQLQSLSSSTRLSTNYRRENLFLTWKYRENSSVTILEDDYRVGLFEEMDCDLPRTNQPDRKLHRFMDDCALHHWSYGIDIPGIKPLGQASAFYDVAKDIGLIYYVNMKQFIRKGGYIISYQFIQLGRPPI